MKEFRIRETCEIKGWTSVRAENMKEAIKKLEDGDGEFDREENCLRVQETFWDSLEEVKQKESKK